MATGSGDMDADRGMGIGVGAGGYGGDGTGSPGYGGGGESSTSGYGMTNDDVVSFNVQHAIKNDPAFNKEFEKAMQSGDQTTMDKIWSGVKVAFHIASAIATRNPISVAAAIKGVMGLISSDPARVEEGKSFLSRAGVSEQEMSDIQTRVADASASVPITNTGTGETATDPETGSNASIEDQFRGLFEGEDAPYPIDDTLTTYTDSTTKALSDYTTKADSLLDRWNQFEQNFDDYYGQMSNQYDDLNFDYDKNREAYNDIFAQQRRNATGYDELKQGYFDKVNSIPQLNMVMPGSMGGGSFAIAPKNWNSVFSNQAETTRGILDSQASAINNQSSTLTDQLRAIDAKRLAYDRKASLLPNWANTLNTALSNAGVTNENLFGNTMKTLGANLYPVDIAKSIFDQDRSIQANQNLLDTKIDAAEPSGWDTWAPVAAAAMPSIIDLGKDLFSGSLFG